VGDRNPALKSRAKIKCRYAAIPNQSLTRAQRDAIVRAIKRKQAPPQYTPLGGLIYIHGHGASSDWTWGCVALENADIEELYRVIPVGTLVTIKP
jgi:L,D-peptidoglycan transpeptidase YkuD (ErfK/YbiS/YcfS/YnhG family)